MNLTLRQKGILIFFTLFSSHVCASFLNTPHPCTHFYLGGALGIAGLMDKESTDNPIKDTHYLGASGAFAEVLTGYDFELRERWKLGLEGFINFVDFKLSANQNYAPQVSYKVKMRYNAGVRLIPGYEISEGTLGHLILGYSYGSFNINDNGNFGIINKNFSANGFQSGLGIETIFSERLSIRTDVLYTTYSAKTSSGITTFEPPSTQFYHNHLSSLEGDLMIIYKI